MLFFKSAKLIFSSMNITVKYDKRQIYGLCSCDQKPKKKNRYQQKFFLPRNRFRLQRRNRYILIFFLLVTKCLSDGCCVQDFQHISHQFAQYLLNIGVLQSSPPTDIFKVRPRHCSTTEFCDFQ